MIAKTLSAMLAKAWYSSVWW